jgi:hypothetical protein
MKIKKLQFILLFFLSFIFVPFIVFSDSLSKNETKSIFKKLKEEIIINVQHNNKILNYFSEEQAVIILSKRVIQKGLDEFIIYKIPQEFLVTAIKEGGPRVVSILVGTSPIEMIINEIKDESIDYILNYLKKEKIRIASGDISLSYTNINGDRASEIFYYFIALDKNNNLSATIYVDNLIFAPTSKASAFNRNNNFEWNYDDFKGDKLKPFSINFSGKAKEGKRTMGFVGKPTINITFYTPGV